MARIRRSTTSDGGTSYTITISTDKGKKCVTVGPDQQTPEQKLAFDFVDKLASCIDDWQEDGNDGGSTEYHIAEVDSYTAFADVILHLARRAKKSAEAAGAVAECPTP